MSTKKVITPVVAALVVAVAAAAALPQDARADALVNYPTLPVTHMDVDRSWGTQEDPHIDGTLVAYTDYASGARVRWFDLATGAGGVVPNPANDYDFLPDVSGSWITFTRITSDRGGIFAFNVESGELRELDGRAGVGRQAAAIGGTTVAWQEYFPSPSQILVHDLAAGSTFRLTDDETMANKNVAVAPDGSLVLWTKCDFVGGGNCDLWQAARADGWTATRLFASPMNELAARTDGDTIAFDAEFGSQRERDIFISHPIGSLAQLSLDGIQANPNISRGLVVFEDFGEPAQAGNWDLAAFDVRTGALYRLTDTPVDETLNDVSVTAAGVVRIVYTMANDIYALSFTLPGRGDATPPVLTVPSAVTADATSPSGAVVTYEATATDDSDPAPAVACAPASGTTFAIGVTTVSCTATDAAGNEAEASFSVTVKGAATQIDDLRDQIESLNLKQGIENSLDAKLRAIQEALDAAAAGDVATACNKLDSFINEVRAQSGKAIAAADADALIADANRIKAVLRCG